MRKSSLFISVVLTAFVLTVLAGAIMTFRTFTSEGPQVSVVQAAPVVQAAASTLTPQEAALTAAQYLGRSDLYSVEGADLNGLAVFKVTFSSGDVVYVSPDGQVVSVVSAPLSVPQGSSGSLKPWLPGSVSSGEDHGSGDDD